MERNIRLYPWFAFCRNLLFWQATWFLYFQQELSAAEAIALYAVYDLATTALEVPSGYMSDRVGRRLTLMLAAVLLLGSMGLYTLGGSFIVFASAQVLMGAGMAFISGTDTALLYESLAADGRDAEVEAQNVRAWRAGFTALAISAVFGGALALYAPVLPYVATALAFVALVWISVRFTEPPHTRATTSELARIRALLGRFREPALLWLMVLGMLMYGFSHIPFVFGQPFIDAALRAVGTAADAPLVSGVVTAVMMVVSLLASLLAPGLRARIGLGALLLIAFAMQVGLALALSLSGSVLAIGLLLLRMVPDAFSTPFLIAHLQPMLGDDSRATFLSLKSLCGRLLFAGSLGLAALFVGAGNEMTPEQLRTILLAYGLVGLILLGGFAMSLRRAGLGSN